MLGLYKMDVMIKNASLRNASKNRGMEDSENKTTSEWLLARLVIGSRYL